MIRVAIVDDHPIVTDGLLANLGVVEEIEVVATGTSADDFHQWCTRAQARHPATPTANH